MRSRCLDRRQRRLPIQRQRALALVHAGRSYSDVVAEVFGNARFRGRMERLVRRERPKNGVVPAAGQLLSQLLRADAAEDVAERGSSLEELVPQYAAMLKRRLEADLPVSGRDLIALADLELRLENRRRVERLNALTRRGPIPEDGAGND